MRIHTQLQKKSTTIKYLTIFLSNFVIFDNFLTAAKNKQNFIYICCFFFESRVGGGGWEVKSTQLFSYFSAKFQHLIFSLSKINLEDNLLHSSNVHKKSHSQ